jgi:hypothetical protein
VKRKRRRGAEKKRDRQYVPIPMTVPYSALLSSADTAGGQRRTRARKRKKAKESPERRRAVCVLVGRDMSGERGKVERIKWLSTEPF